MIIDFFYSIMEAVFQLFQLEITIDEYTFTLWTVFIFACVCTLVAKAIGRLGR